MKLKIWHKYKHDDFKVTEVKVLKSFADAISAIRADGGLVSENGFIPWHSISYIELREESAQ